MLLSVILPCYNVSEYVEECIQSLLNQKFYDFEIIAVDDGSTDDTGLILDRYQTESRIRVIHQSNQGLGAARNRGFKEANGKYVVFIDSDDFVEPDFFNSVINAAEINSADIVLFGARNYYNEKKEFKSAWYYMPDKKIIGDALVFNRKKFPDTIMQAINVATWNKVYKRNFLVKEGLEFQKLHNCEDVAMVMTSLCLAERIVCVNNCFYNYRRGRKNSLTQTKQKYPLCFIAALEKLYDTLHEKKVFHEVEKSFINFAVNQLTYHINKMPDFENVKALIINALKQQRFKQMNLTQYPDVYYQDKSKIGYVRDFIEGTTQLKFGDYMEQEKFITARLDIKNFNTENNCVAMVWNTDSAARVQFPAWFKNAQGQGVVIHSTKGLIELEVRCIGQGNLRISLRGMDCRDENNKRIPVWVNYVRFEIDGKSIFADSHLAWHDQPYTYNMSVTDGQVVHLCVAWKRVEPQCQQAEAEKKVTLEQSDAENRLLNTHLKNGLDINSNGKLPFPKSAEREKWQYCFGKELLVQEADEALQQYNFGCFKPLTLSLWLEYYDNGNRSRYEEIYFARRKALCCLTMGECITGSGKYMAAVCDLLWMICEEKAWWFPAHNSQNNEYRDTAKFPLPDTDHPIVDLFAAETAATVSLLCFILDQQLEALAPGIKQQVFKEVDRRVIQPYLKRDFYWKGHKGKINNWGPWCTQNILAAACAFYIGKKDVLQDVINESLYTLQKFLDGYREDGCCDEGVHYYRRAGLCFMNGLLLLRPFLNKYYDRVFKETKVKNMAEYLLHMHVTEDRYLNFGDCSAKDGYCGVREYLFGKAVGSMPLMALAARDVKRTSDPFTLHTADAGEGTNLLFFLQTAFYGNEAMPLAENNSSGIRINSIWYPSVGVLSCRAGGFVAGVKAGCNADSHNHNDVGNVVLYYRNKPVLIDIGAEYYTKQSFSKARYSIWTMQSSWHNLPEFDPYKKKVQQKAGREFCAKSVEVSESKNSIRMNIAFAYIEDGNGFGLHEYWREVSLTDDRFLIKDETDYKGLIALNLILASEPVIYCDENTISKVEIGDNATLDIMGAEKIETESVSVQDVWLKRDWAEKIYRLRCYFYNSIEIKARNI